MQKRNASDFSLSAVQTVDYLMKAAPYKAMLSTPFYSLDNMQLTGQLIHYLFWWNLF
jgi:hypothetical protein